MDYSSNNNYECENDTYDKLVKRIITPWIPLRLNSSFYRAKVYIVFLILCQLVFVRRFIACSYFANGRVFMLHVRSIAVILFNDLMPRIIIFFYVASRSLLFNF